VTLVVSPRIPQRLAPNGLYVQRVGSSTMTWDQARVHYNTAYKNHPELRTFQGVVGDWTKLTDLARSSVVASLGDIWLPGTDADVVSRLDGFDLTTLGTGEGTFKWLDGADVAAACGAPTNE